MRSKLIFFALLPIIFLAACDDTDQVGASVQPDEDLLRVHSNMVNVETFSMLADSALSKSSYLFLGYYEDPELGTTRAEFMTQFDARLGSGGLTAPDTMIFTSASEALSKYDSNYGAVTRISSPENVRANSLHFVMKYSDDIFFSDTILPKSLNVYALNKDLSSSYTNTDVSVFCNRDTLLGEHAYNVTLRNKEIIFELGTEKGKNFANRLVKAYTKDSNIKNQTDFNRFFKGVYVSHYLGAGCIMKIESAYMLLTYSYDALITTTYGGRDTVINSATLPKEHNPLVSSIVISANKSVERVNLIEHADLKEKFSALQSKNRGVTYTYTPAGIYTGVNVPFGVMVDSIKREVQDTTKVMFNIARLILYTKTSTNKASMLSGAPNPYMLLIDKDSIIPFFRKNKSPDAVSTFAASYSSANESYTFDITKAVQKKLSGENTPFSEKMVLVPIVVEQSDGINYYRQQLWITATMLHGMESDDDTKKPRIDMVYTQRK